MTAVATLTICFTAMAVIVASNAGMARNWILIALGVVGLFPLSELALQIVNVLIVSLLPPQPLPKMDFRDGIPPQNSTLTVVPMMLSSLRDVRTALEKLEVRYLGNRNANLFYSLFSDFADAPEAVTPSDARLLKAAREGIAALKSAIRVQTASVFFCFTVRGYGLRASSAGWDASGSAESWKS